MGRAVVAVLPWVVPAACSRDATPDQGGGGSTDDASGTGDAPDDDGGDDDPDDGEGDDDTGDPPTPCTYVPGACDPICIEDLALDGLVRAALGLAAATAITPDDAAALTAIVDDETTDVASLAGLECFTNLQVIGFAHDSFDDLGPIAGLPALQDVIIRDAPVADLPALASRALVQLWLVDTQVSDLSALQGSPLQELLVSGSPVADLAVVATLPNLWRLEAHGTQVSNLDPIAAAPALYHVEIDGASISDVSPLATAASLGLLSLRDNAIEDVTALGGLPQLELLWLSGNPITDLAPLADLPMLGLLAIADTQVSDLSPLSAVPLDSIEVDRAPLIDPEQLWTLPGLRSVSAAAIGLSTLEGIPTGVEMLAVPGNDLVDLVPILGLTALSELDVADNAITDLAAVQDAPLFDQPCRRLVVTGNPLDTESTDVVLPALCEAGIVVAADSLSCEQDEACGPID